MEEIEELRFREQNINALIEALEKVKIKLNDEIDIVNVLLDPIEYEDYHELVGVIRGYKLGIEIIDQQIKFLKDKKFETRD